MGNDGCLHVSHKISPAEIGLGWLSGIIEWTTARAVHMRPHMHSHIELIFCLKNTMTYKVNGHGNITLHEGETALGQRKRGPFDADENDPDSGRRLT